MDVQARAQLITQIVEQQKSGGEVAVSLDLFFAGNDDQGSIGCNLGEAQPTIQEFYRRLTLLRDREEVQDILVRISDADDCDSWPYADTVYVISSLPQDEIETALDALMFDEVTPGWMYGQPGSAPAPVAGFIPYSIWWD